MCYMYFEVLLFCLFFNGFGLCQQEINVALQSNGGTCTSTIAMTGGSDCHRLIDGNLTNDGKWFVDGNLIGNRIQFEFRNTYQILRVVVLHPYYADERNIKDVNLDFHDESTILFPLVNNTKGNATDEIVVNGSQVSRFMNMTITSVKEDKYTSLKEVYIYGIEVTPTLSTESSSTTSDTTVLITTTTAMTDDTSQISTKETETTASTTIRTSSSTSSPSTSSSTTSTTATTSAKSSTAPSSTTTTTGEIVTREEYDISTTKLPLSTSYIIYTTAEEGAMDERTVPSPGKLSVGTIVGIVIAILVIAVVVFAVGFIFFRRKVKKNMDEQPDDKNFYVDIKTIERASKSKPDTKNQTTVVDPPTEDKTSLDSSPDTSPESSVRDTGEPEYANTQPLPVSSNAIQFEDLASTLDAMLQTPKIFQDEFKSIPAGKQHATTFADRSTLQPKNRFKNIKPYDHSRVSLVQKESADSVYINANFISAYKRPKYYIAAQGPNVHTCADFWRMVWEQHVSVIVMVTNCIEAGRDKCEQYWPDGGKGAQRKYGEFNVTIDKNTLVADYEIRDFLLSQNDESRDVRQYHYTSWPDEGVPTSCSALISFVNRIREFTDDKEPPIVVHCSAGVGRTGTFIVVNYSIDMAREEGIVDIKKVVHQLREDRINMVQTLSQYKFLYTLMLECLYYGEVTIPCQGASEKIQQIFIQEDGMDSPAEKQWIVLEVLKPKKYDEECLAGKDNDNIEKNRTQTILPHDNHRPYLRRRPDYTSNYINAVFVDGYKQKNKFLLTQHPLENTIVDLWRTVSDFNVSTIVMLNGCEENADAYWPEDEFSEALQYGDFLEVTFKRVDKQVDFTITELDLSEDKEKANVVTHIHVKNWSEDSKPKLSILPALYNTVSQAQMTDEDSRIMIHSLNGGGNTGVYCALHQIFDKIKEEQEIDIFNAVKNTRMPRPDSIPDLETYKYLHEASVQFIEEFSTYANFR